MSDPIEIHVDKAVTSAAILDDYRVEYSDDKSQNGTACSNGGEPIKKSLSPNAESQQSEAISKLKEQEAELARVYQTVCQISDKLNKLYTDILAKHKDEIAKLSVEIANKVLMHKIEQGDYKIEAIIKEALRNAPTHQEIVVHLNPDDVIQCQKMQENDPSSSFAQIKFVADPGIGRAECLVETPKGIIKSLIDEHMERITEALTKEG